MEPRLIPPVKEMFKKMAPHMGVKGFILKNIAWFFPVLHKKLSQNPSTNAMIRTTFAFTMAEAGDAPNVLPQKAWAVVNVRILQGDSIETVIKHIKRVNKGIDFEIEKLMVEEPSRVSDMESSSYKIMENVIHKIYPDALVMLYLMAGATDSRKYRRLSNNIYRFAAMLLDREELDSIHATNERIAVKSFETMIDFYVLFLRQMCEG